MDPKEIRELIELISRSSFTSFELEREGFRLRLAREQVAPPARIPEPRVEPGMIAVPAAPVVREAGPVQAVAPDPGLVELKSPIVGTYYSSTFPDAAPLVQVGSTVQKGQVVCIIEAMKVMNEIEAEFGGEVVEVVVANGQPVEYGETLFRLRGA